MYGKIIVMSKYTAAAGSGGVYIGGFLTLYARKITNPRVFIFKIPPFLYTCINPPLIYIFES